MSSDRYQACFGLPEAVLMVWVDTRVGSYGISVGANSCIGPEQNVRGALGAQS